MPYGASFAVAGYAAKALFFGDISALSQFGATVAQRLQPAANPWGAVAKTLA
jgi:hypothetical protein